MKVSDKLNAQYTSKDRADVLSFYAHFKDRNSLITWSKKRRHGRAKIYEIAGDKSIIVVIPTTNHNGKFAKIDKKIFKGFHIIFVDSKGLDPYFNFSRNSNIGLKYALRYKPLWVVLSNDDVLKIDNANKLRNELCILDNKKFEIVGSPSFTFPANIKQIKKFNPIRKMIRWLLKRNRYKMNLNEYLKYSRDLDLLSEKFGITAIPNLTNNKNATFYWSGFFNIFSYNFLKRVNGKPFDETFIVGVEDAYLSSKINKNRVGWITFKIKHRQGMTAGHPVTRELRDVLNKAYLNKLLGAVPK